MTGPKSPHGPKRNAPNFSTSTSSGVEPNVAAALSYVLGLITGIFFLVLEKENRFIRFHAAQSVAVSVIVIAIGVGVSIISSVLAFIPLIGWIGVLVLTLGLAFGTFALWLLLMFRAYQGEEWELPVAGGMARRVAG